MKMPSAMIYSLKRWFWTVIGDILIYPKPLFIQFGPTSYRVKGNDMRVIMEELVPGDILLRRFAHYLDSYLIPGRFTHAAIYVGNTIYSPQTVVHAMSEGVFAEDILTFMRCDEVCVLRSTLHYKHLEAVTSYAMDHIGTPYDFDFLFEDTRRMTCTEFVYRCFANHIPELGLKFTMRYGRPTLIPDDFLKANLKEIIRKPEY